MLQAVPKGQVEAINLMIKKILREGVIVAEHGDPDAPWGERFSTNRDDQYNPETLHTVGYVVADLGLDSVLDPPKQVFEVHQAR